MENSRRKFLKYAGMAGLSIAGSKFSQGLASVPDSSPVFSDSITGINTNTMKEKEENLSIIGQYGKWASSLNDNKIPSLSFRRKEWSDLKKWKTAAEAKVKDRLSIPDIGGKIGRAHV